MGLLTTSGLPTNRTRLFAILLLTLAGFFVGWVISKNFNHTAKTELHGSVVNSVAQPKETKKAALVARQDVDSKRNEISLPLSASDLLEEILSEPIDYELTATRIIDYFTLQLKNQNTSVLGEKQLRNLLKSEPDINFALIDKFASVEDQPTRRQLAMHLMINNRSMSPFLEPKLIEKVKLHEDRAEMLQLLGEWGLQSKSNIKYMAEELPYLENPIDTGNAIRAISGSSWALNSILAPDDKAYLTKMIESHRSSKHDVIRAASMAALRSFPTQDYQQIVINGLSDHSALVRQEATLLYFNNPFESSNALDSLINQLKDGNIDINQRTSIAHQLGQLRVSENQRKIIEDFKSESKKNHQLN